MLACKLLSSVVLAAMALASPLSMRTDAPITSCNEGQLQCCNQSQVITPKNTTDPMTALVMDIVDIVASVEAAVFVGINCTPISAIGSGSADCGQSTLCCTGETYSAVSNVTIGCSPFLTRFP